ncbi:hypothetical protein G6F68_016490 [Rhizopus microsporus]|nr:hypothetical protein G6F68_016490 [Rhizopus microsporus]
MKSGMVGAGNADPVRVHGFPRRAGPVLGLPVAAVSLHRVPAGQQERADAAGVRARPGRAGAAAHRAGGAEPVRGIPEVPGPLRACRAGGVRNPRLDPAARGRRRTAAGVRAHLPGHRPLLARVLAVRGPGGPGDRLPAVAIPTHARWS